jgi:GNAT superfamily N-acetyltransferase
MTYRKTNLRVEIIRPSTPAEEIIALSLQSGPDDEDRYRKIMSGFIANSLAGTPDLELGIVYGLYDGDMLLASARIRQDDYTDDIVSIEYVAVRSDLHKQGLGRVFMQGLFAEVRGRWQKKGVMLATGDERVFYEKIGMTLFAQLPEEGGTMRSYMYKDLSVA